MKGFAFLDYLVVVVISARSRRGVRSRFAVPGRAFRATLY